MDGEGMSSTFNAKIWVVDHIVSMMMSSHEGKHSGKLPSRDAFGSHLPDETRFMTVWEKGEICCRGHNLELMASLQNGGFVHLLSTPWHQSTPILANFRRLTTIECEKDTPGGKGLILRNY